jgi:hypothetical protein
MKPPPVPLQPIQALTILSREDRLITDGLLCECHHIIYILRGGHPGLLALVIKPQVGPAKDILQCSVLVIIFEISVTRTTKQYYGRKPRWQISVKCIVTRTVT